MTATIKSQNYSINSSYDNQYSRGDGQIYSLSGSTSYAVEPKDKGKEFFLAITSNKIRGSMNYNMNDNCTRMKD